jgi:hypothetical protein
LSAGGPITPTVEVGTILIEDRPRITKFLELESESCSGKWSVVHGLDGFALDRKIHAAGWNFFFIAAEVKVMFFGAPGTAKIKNALHGILAKVRLHNFNCLEVTGIAANRFFGVPYTTVSAHSRHIQQGWRLDGAEERRSSQHDAASAKD